MQSDLNNPELFFNKQVQKYASRLNEVTKKIRNTSISRIIVFLLTVVGIYLTTVFNGWWVAGTGVSGLVVFMILVIRHVKLFHRKHYLRKLLEVNENELLLLNLDTKNQHTGEEYLSTEHPYAVDLDVFGDRSLFQLLDRSATNEGRDKLAAGLLSPELSPETIRKRQKAIAELAVLPQWRQEFQALGGDENAVSIDGLLQWAQFDGRAWNKTLYKILTVLTPLLGLGIVTLIGLGELGFGAFLLFLLLPLTVLGLNFNAINAEYGQLGKKNRVLKMYAVLFQKTEDQNFKSELLKQAQQILVGKDHSAARAFQQLESISKAFDYRLNFLVGFTLDIFFLWDIRQLMRLEKWKKNYGKEMQQWFESLSAVDELCSYAGFAFQYTEAVFPELSDTFSLHGENLKHPFIAKEKCVGNPVKVAGWKQFQIITGANMAGKSTYLRTVGINLLLANCGAPVLGESMVFKPVQLFTGIKTSDSLQDGESYFFAELKHLHNMIQQLERGEQLFIILDEILRGTNSKDKQKGSKALLKQLIRFNASGLVATHDLALGSLADDFPENIINKRFEVEIENNQLIFDYQLKNGVSQNLNATFLMKKMGITV
jgi:hypothetical protein